MEEKITNCMKCGKLAVETKNIPAMQGATLVNCYFCGTYRKEVNE